MRYQVVILTLLKTNDKESVMFDTLEQQLIEEIKEQESVNQQMIYEENLKKEKKR